MKQTPFEKETLLIAIDKYFPAVRIKQQEEELGKLGSVKTVKFSYQTIVRVKRGIKYYEIPVIDKVEVVATPENITNAYGRFVQQCYMVLRLWMNSFDELESVSQMEEVDRLHHRIDSRDRLKNLNRLGNDTLGADDTIAIMKSLHHNPYANQTVHDFLSADYEMMVKLHKDHLFEYVYQKHKDKEGWVEFREFDAYMAEVNVPEHLIPLFRDQYTEYVNKKLEK